MEDHIKHQMMQTSSLFHFLKKAIQFIFSLSFVSFLLSSSSLLVVLLHDYGIDRHYIFLLCNGLLVFIVKNSGLVSNSPSWGMDRADAVIKSRAPAPELSGLEPQAAGEKDVKGVEEEGWREKGVLITEKGRTQNGVFTAEEEDGDEEERPMEQPRCLLAVKEEEEAGGEEEDDHEIGLLSTEELNKRFDDFIKRMKEEIKIEAQQLVVERRPLGFFHILKFLRKQTGKQLKLTWKSLGEEADKRGPFQGAPFFSLSVHIREKTLK